MWRKCISTVSIDIDSPERCLMPILYSSWLKRDHGQFAKTLFANKNLDLAYPLTNEGLRITDLTAKALDGAKYLQSIINAGYNVNDKNKLNGRVAAHYAAEVGNIHTLEVLLKNSVDLNVQDNDGDTPLHTLIENWSPNFIQCLNLLLNSSKVAVNVPNNEGSTPISLVRDESVLREFLTLGVSLDLDTFRSEKGNNTCRETILLNFPHLKDQLPQGPWERDLKKKPIHLKYRLFYLIKAEDEKEFCQTLQDIKIEKTDLVSCYDIEGYTMLQRAAQKGHPTAIKALIRAGANVNHAKFGTKPPILIAAINGKLKAFNELICDPEIDVTTERLGEPLLHIMVRMEKKTPSYFEILSCLLRHPQIKINDKDTNGNTALHLATLTADEKTIFFLLDNRADLLVTNKSGKTPLDQFAVLSFKKYLDSKINTNKEPPKSNKFAYIFDYKFAISNVKKRHIFSASADILTKVESNFELRDLLCHPAFATIILCKWHRIRIFFYLYLLLYSLFCIILTGYLSVWPIFLPQWDTTMCNSTALLNISQIINDQFPSCDYTCKYLIAQKIEIFLLMFVALLAVAEVLDFIASSKHYICDFENWLQAGVVFTTVASIYTGNYNCYQCFEMPTCYNFNLYAIFFAWLELFFVLGKHPKLTVYVDMFRTVSFFLLRFLIVHTSLILAFAFSFYNLFRDKGSSSFTTVSASLFKTIVMITSEFNIKEIPLTSPSDYILFSCFLFLVAIVLFNLLIGLAVSATRPIEEDPFLYSCLAQVPIISYVENTLMKVCDLCSKAYDFCSRRQQHYSDNILKLFVYPNEKNRIEIYLESDGHPVQIIKIRYRMSKKTLSDYQQIISTRKQTEEREVQDIRIDKLDELKEMLQNIVEIKHTHPRKYGTWSKQSNKVRSAELKSQITSFFERSSKSIISSIEKTATL